MNEEKRIKIVRNASLIALTGNIIICFAKVVIGFYTNSLAVLGDGLDSATDIAISAMTLIVSYIINRPSDKEHPWGHQRAETLATLILSFVITAAGLNLLFAAGQKFIEVVNGTAILVLPHRLAILVTIFSITGKLLLALNQHFMGKRANSMMIRANAKNMANDVILSASVLAGLSISYLFNIPIFDIITALIVAVWILKSSIELFIELNVELMDGNTNNVLYRQLFEAVNSVDGVYNPHRARIRKMANLLDIVLDIEVAPNINVYEAHLIAEKVTTAIKNNIENVYDVMVHIEPHSSENSEPEGFGLCEDDVKAE